jgi:purine-binding chemotaxis protein CheW
MSIPSPQAGLPATGAVKAPVVVEASPAQYLTFQLGGEMFAVGILNIKEIIEYGSVTEIPMVPPFIRGVINLRGAVVPVIDLASRFGGKRSEVSRRTCIVIIELAEGEERQDIGVVVDSVSEVLEIPASEIEPPPAFGARIRADFIKGMGKVSGKFVIILDVAKVLSVDEIASLSQLSGDAVADAVVGNPGQA